MSGYGVYQDLKIEFVPNSPETGGKGYGATFQIPIWLTSYGADKYSALRHTRSERSRPSFVDSAVEVMPYAASPPSAYLAQG
jgi:hypothetical protein